MCITMSVRNYSQAPPTMYNYVLKYLPNNYNNKYYYLKSINLISLSRRNFRGRGPGAGERTVSI